MCVWKCVIVGMIIIVRNVFYGRENFMPSNFGHTEILCYYYNCCSGIASWNCSFHLEMSCFSHCRLICTVLYRNWSIMSASIANVTDGKPFQLSFYIRLQAASAATSLPRSLQASSPTYMYIALDSIRLINCYQGDSVTSRVFSIIFLIKFVLRIAGVYPS